MCRYSCVIEDPDGYTWTQQFNDWEELQELKASLGPDYWIVDIYSNE